MAVRRASFSFPRQWSPAIAPSWPIEIDPTADLSGGLRDLALAATGRNYVDGVRPWLPNTATIVQTAAGPAYQSDGSTTYSQIAYQTGLTNLANFSVGLLCIVPSVPTAYSALLESGGNSSVRNFSIFLGSATPAPINYSGIGGGSGFAPSGTTNFGIGGVSAFITSVSSGAATFYVNGAGGATSLVNGSEASAAANWVFGTNPTGGGSAIAAQYLLFATWNRTLTQAEAALFGSAPFSMFRPVVRRTYYGTPITGTTISVSESGSAADTFTETMTAAVAVSESGSAADAEAVSARIADAEAGTASDTIGQIMSAPISVSEAGTAADTISETMTALISVSEAGTAVDTITATVSGAFAIGVSESGSAADTISEVMTALISVSEAGAALDTITLALAGTFFIGVSESGAATDSFTVTGGVQPTPPVGPTAGFDAGPGIGRWFNLAFKAGSGRRRVREGLGAEIEALASPEAAETPEEVVSAAIEALAETEIAAENDALERIWEHEARYAELVGERESLYASTQAFIQAVEAAAREELGRRERAVVQRREDAEMVVILMALG